MEISGGEMWDLRWCEINGGGISGGLSWDFMKRDYIRLEVGFPVVRGGISGGLRWVFRWLEVGFQVA